MTPEAQGDEPAEATVDPDRCPACSKRLSPVWKTKCEHCHTPYSPDLIAARVVAFGSPIRGPLPVGDAPVLFIGRASTWMARHRLVGPSGLGLAAGVALLAPFAVASAANNSAVGTIASLTLIALYGGTSVPGYVLGLAGIRGAGLLLYAGGLLTPLVVALVVRSTPSTASTDCPSCAADVLALMWPFILAMLLAPFAIGYLRGRRAQRRTAERILAAR
jgi:hypothetical protein